VSASTSPFPPIADYAFLSNCHTGALVAPDGSVDWLCLPAFDAPSTFGNLLDRGAGSFRFGPYAINVPTARVYVPGTNVMTTTWHTPSGWLLVHDALTIGLRQGHDSVTPHTRPPADDDADHMLVRTVECLDGSVEGSSWSASPRSTTGVLRPPGPWWATTITPPTRPAPVRPSG
jgi:alpha,alpha-trehalase